MNLLLICLTIAAEACGWRWTNSGLIQRKLSLEHPSRPGSLLKAVVLGAFRHENA
jgi:hypothetical protein